MTTPQLRVLAFGALAVVAFDVLASLASRQFGFAYGRASVGSYVIYLVVGFFAARANSANALSAAAMTAGIVGFIDASVGWAASWAIGPGRLPGGAQLTVARWIGTAIFVLALAGAIGLVGGLAGRRSASVVAAV